MKLKSGFSKENLETYFKNGIEYYKSNHRMVYNPEFHDMHGLPWSEEDVAYICQMRPGAKWRDISLAVGRTENVCMNKYYAVKKSGKLNYYRELE